MTRIWVSELTIIGSDNGLSPERLQAIVWINAEILFNWALGNKRQWDFNRKLYIFIPEYACENVVCEMAAIFPGLNVLTHLPLALKFYHFHSKNAFEIVACQSGGYFVRIRVVFFYAIYPQRVFGG